MHEHETELSPFVFATAHLLEDALEDYPKMLDGKDVNLSMIQLTRLKMLGEFDNVPDSGE